MADDATRYQECFVQGRRTEFFQNVLAFPPRNETRISLNLSNMKKLLSGNLVRTQIHGFRLPLAIRFLVVVCSLDDGRNWANTLSF